MNPQELRLNNWVSNNGEPIQVKEIYYMVDIDEAMEGYCINNTYAQCFEPIPLTPEILEAAGFEYKNGWMVNGGDLQVDQYVFGQFDIMYADTGQINLSWRDKEVINIQYVHQLQNLYFALTATELEINL